MGRAYTPAHRVEFKTDNGMWTPQGWRREHGRPTAGRLYSFVKAYESSTRPGGANAHIGATKVLAARIVTNVGEAKLVAGYVHSRTDAQAQINWLMHAVSVPALGLDVAYGD